MISVFSFRFAVAVPILCACCCSLRAQGAAGAQQTKAQQLPISGRQSPQTGSVAVQQSTTPGGDGSGSSVNTSTTSIQVQGSYTGSVSASDTPDASVLSVTITLEQAVWMGLRYNLGTVSGGASLRQVRAQRLAALSQLLPTVNGIVSETGTKEDLQTTGISSGVFGGGVSLPTTVGPFHYYDARASVNFNVIDRTAVHNYRASGELEKASGLSDRDARELVVLAVGSEYLRVLADAALVESQEAQVTYAKSSYDQAVAQRQAGTRSPVDTERSQVEWQTAQQRLISRRADLIKQKRFLARMIGLRLDADVVLAEKMSYTPAPPIPFAEALRRAWSQRADLGSAAAQERAAEEGLKAARSEQLPMVSVNGFVGLEGANPDAGVGVFSGTASVTVPIFQGGRIRADREQAQAAVDQRRAEYQDQRGVVELDVRNAYTDFETAAEQVRLAESNRTLALLTLRQAQDRFGAGVATSVEVVQAQETLASADLDYVNSLYAHNLAKISVARALGQAETGIADFLKGQ
jgi:outer membrane protein TolC